MNGQRVSSINENVPKTQGDAAKYPISVPQASAGFVLPFPADDLELVELEKIFVTIDLPKPELE